MNNKTDRATLEKIFQVPARLKIMSTLMVKKNATFSDLIDSLELTRGNLSMHMKNLDGHGYIKIEKKFVGKKPMTTYIITKKGRENFSRYISILEQIINPFTS